METKNQNQNKFLVMPVQDWLKYWLKVLGHKEGAWEVIRLEGERFKYRVGFVEFLESRLS